MSTDCVPGTNLCTICTYIKKSSNSPSRLALLGSAFFFRSGHWHRVTDNLAQEYTAEPRSKQRLCEQESASVQASSQCCLRVCFTHEGQALWEWRSAFLLICVCIHTDASQALNIHPSQGWRWLTPSPGDWPTIPGSPKKLFTFPHSFLFVINLFLI